MLIRGRITSGVSNKGSTQLIFNGVDLSMLYAKEVVVTYCRKCIGSRLRKNVSDHCRRWILSSCNKCSGTWDHSIIEALEPSHRMDNASMAMSWKRPYLSENIVERHFNRFKLRRWGSPKGSSVEGKAIAREETGLNERVTTRENMKKIVSFATHVISNVPDVFIITQIEGQDVAKMFNRVTKG